MMKTRSLMNLPSWSRNEEQVDEGVILSVSVEVYGA